MAFVKKETYTYKNDQRTVQMTDFSGGLRLGAKYDCGKNAFPILENMYLEGGLLCARKGQREIAAIEGTPHSRTGFRDGELIHSGENLYFFNGKELSFISSVPDCHSIMFSFGKLAYLLCAEGYFCYDEKLSPVEPYVPVVMIDRVKDGSESKVYEDFNLIGAKFKVKFNYAGAGDYVLPSLPIDGSFYLVELNGADISNACELNAEQGLLTVPEKGQKETGVSNLTVTLKLSDERYLSERKKIFGCSLWEDYGGESGSGTRIFLSGNPEYPSHLFRSGLLMPNYFPDSDFELVGFGDDCVTAMKKQYDELIVFCKRSVHAVSYKTADTAVIFACRTINSVVGCDLPETVQSVNNNLVFANSKKGIFTVTSTISETENNVVPISANVNDTEDGFLACDSSEGVWSCEHGGMYFLFVKGKCYVWDYHKTPYVSLPDLKKAQKRLCWYLFLNFDAKIPFECEGKLYYVSKGRLALYGDSEDDFGESINARVVTAPSGLGAPKYVKCPESIFITYKGRGNTKATVDFYCNDRDFSQKPDGSITISSANFSWSDLRWDMFSFLIKNATRYFKAALRLPKAYSYALQISSKLGGFCLERIELTYRI